MPRVVVAAEYGGPEVLQLVDVPTPTPQPGQVVIDVRAVGVNRADIKRYAGVFGRDPAQLPLRLGYEAAGVVTAVGADAHGPAGPVRVGDEVIAFPVDGGYAEQLLVPASALVPKPQRLDWEQAAGLLLTGATAVHALAATGLRAGETVVVHGASGGVGTMAVQLAVARGARVIGTASPGRHDFLRELGAVPVSYGAGLAERIRAVGPVSAAIDTVGSDEAVDVSLELVADRDRIATIAAFGRAAAAGIKLLGGGPGADPGTAVRDAARLDLTRLVDQGVLRVFVERSYPLVDVAKAHQQLSAGHTRGKIVLVP